MKKKVSLILSLLIITSLLFTGCSRFQKETFDAPGYIKAILDATYLGAMPEKDNIIDTTPEKVKAEYDASMKKAAQTFASYYGIKNPSQDILDQFEQWVKKVYSKCSYDVKEGESDSDNIYKVTVALRPIDILSTSENAVNKYIKDFDKKNKQKKFSGYTEEQYNAVYAEGLLQLLGEYADSITYREEESITVTVTLNSEDKYQADSTALSQIAKKIIYLPEN